MRILTVNLGSTSSKVGIFHGAQEVQTHTFRHPKQELEAHGGIRHQKDYRKKVLEDWLLSQGEDLSGFDVFSMRGGLVRPVEGGIYRISRGAVEDAMSGKYEMHAANLGMAIGYEWEQTYHKPAIFTDAPVTDELSDLAQVTGFSGTRRRSVFHALNAKRTVRLYCREKGLDPGCSRLIVVHMGGGITVSACENLRAIDVNNGVDGEGPFSPERVGALSNAILFQLLKEAGSDPQKLRDQLYLKGGLMSYFGTNDVKLLCERAQSEPEVRLVLDAMIYNVAKQTAAMAAALRGKVDQILITGGLAFSQELVEQVIDQTAWIAPCSVYPGEDELAALAEGAVRFLSGEERAKTYIQGDCHV